MKYLKNIYLICSLFLNLSNSLFMNNMNKMNKMNFINNMNNTISEKNKYIKLLNSSRFFIKYSSLFNYNLLKNEINEYNSKIIDNNLKFLYNIKNIKVIKNKSFIKEYKNYMVINDFINYNISINSDIKIFNYFLDIHDFLHIITGLNSSILEEVSLKLFEFYLTKLPYYFFVFLTGFLMLNKNEKNKFFYIYLPWINKNIKKCRKKLLIFDYSTNYNKDLSLLRNDINIEPFRN